MSDTMIGVVGTILGAIVGFALSEISNYIRRNMEVNKQREALYQVILMELESGIGSLQQYKVQLERGFKPGKRLIVAENKATFWTREMWASQLPLLTGALTPDQIKMMYTFYALWEGAVTLSNALATETNEGRMLAIVATIKDHVDQTIAAGTPLMEQLRTYVRQSS